MGFEGTFTKAYQREMRTRSLINTIMGQMNRIEDKVGQCFHEAFPTLETQVWDAIDAKDVSKLNAVIKELDQLT